MGATESGSVRSSLLEAFLAGGQRAVARSWSHHPDHPTPIPDPGWVSPHYSFPPLPTPPATGAISGHLAAKCVGDIPSEAPYFPHRSPIRAKEGTSQVAQSRWIPGKSVPALVPEPGEPRHLPPAVTHPLHLALP